MKKLEKYTIDDYLKSDDNFEPISNLMFILDISTKYRIYNIDFQFMKNKFGDFNFKDDYNGAFWWMFEFKGYKFAFWTHHVEGSEIYLLNRERQDSDIIPEFVKKLFYGENI